MNLGSKAQEIVSVAVRAATKTPQSDVESKFYEHVSLPGSRDGFQVGGALKYRRFLAPQLQRHRNDKISSAMRCSSKDHVKL